MLWVTRTNSSWSNRSVRDNASTQGTNLLSKFLGGEFGFPLPTLLSKPASLDVSGHCVLQQKKGILSIAQASLPPIYLSQLLCSKPVGKGTARRCRDLSSGLPFLTQITNPTACLTWFSFVHCVSAVSFCSNNYLLGRKGKGESVG